MIPYEVPVTQPGSAVHQKTSSGWRSSAERPGGVVRDHGLVHVDSALGSAGGATGEVEERHRFGVGRADFVGPLHFGEELWKEDRALRGRVVDDENVLEVAEVVSVRSHPPAEEA